MRQKNTPPTTPTNPESIELEPEKLEEPQGSRTSNIPTDNDETEDFRILTQIDKEEIKPGATSTTQRLIEIQDTISKLSEQNEEAQKQKEKQRNHQLNLEQEITDLQDDNLNQDEKITSMANDLSHFTTQASDNIKAAHERTNKIEKQIKQILKTPLPPKANNKASDIEANTQKIQEMARTMQDMQNSILKLKHKCEELDNTKATLQDMRDTLKGNQESTYHTHTKQSLQGKHHARHTA